MAAPSAVLPLAGSGIHFGSCYLHPNKLSVRRSQQTLHRKSTQLRNLSVRSEYGNDSRGGGGDFLGGFFLGGAVFGTLAYIYSPQIRRVLLDENEAGFRRARRPIYYEDDVLERTRQSLNAKIDQLDAAIDNIASRLLRGGNKSKEAVPIKTGPEAEAAVQRSMPPKITDLSDVKRAKGQ